MTHKCDTCKHYWKIGFLNNYPTTKDRDASSEYSEQSHCLVSPNFRAIDYSIRRDVIECSKWEAK